MRGRGDHLTEADNQASLAGRFNAEQLYFDHKCSALQPPANERKVQQQWSAVRPGRHHCQHKYNVDFCNGLVSVSQRLHLADKQCSRSTSQPQMSYTGAVIIWPRTCPRRMTFRGLRPWAFTSRSNNRDSRTVQQLAGSNEDGKNGPCISTPLGRGHFFQGSP